MIWQECKRCHKRMFQPQGRPLPHQGYCEDCYEIVTGQCAECQGTGQINRAHLGSMECAKCDGGGRARRNSPA